MGLRGCPFGVQTSKHVGFHVVAIFNERDGRDEKAIRPYADLFVHGYPELSLARIRDLADSPSHVEGVMHALVVDRIALSEFASTLVRSLALAATTS